MKKPILWAYGLTTVPERIKNHLLTRTMKSLAAAGFDKPRLFLDGAEKVVDAPSLGQVVRSKLEITVRSPRLHLPGNWILALWELYLRNPTAHRFVLFQDDIVVCRNLRAYLESCPYKETAYYNLITYQQNEDLADGRTGWYHSNQCGRGAQALMFDRETIIALLGNPHLPRRMQEPRHRASGIDGGVSDSLRVQGFKEYVHMPSLVAHTGAESTIGHRKQKAGKSFPGEDWDPAHTKGTDALGDPFLRSDDTQ